MKQLSKINYLLVVFLLLFISFVIISQLRLTTQSATQLLLAEIVKKIEMRIIEVYGELKRFPNADKEIETLVLHQLNLSQYPKPVFIEHFCPGSDSAPARFQLSIKEKVTSPTITIWLEYYGSEYQMDLVNKGNLLKKRISYLF